MKLVFRNLKPNKQNAFVWLNALFLIVLLFTGVADAVTIIIAYFLETIIIGIVHVFKMNKIIMNSEDKSERAKIIFFLIHYLFFVAIQLIFVFLFLSMEDKNIKEPFNLIENINHVMNYKGMTFVLLSILIYNIADYYVNFIQSQIYKTLTIDKVFAQPYIRIFIQQFVVILSVFFMMITSVVLIAAILLIVFKTFIELCFVAYLNDASFIAYINSKMKVKK